MVLLDVPDGCVAYADHAADVALLDAHERAPAFERALRQSLPCSILMAAPAYGIPVASELILPEPVGLGVPPAPQYTSADLVAGELEPDAVLKELLRIENRPVGLRALGRAMVDLRAMVPADPLTAVPIEDVARLDRLERAAIAAATPTELMENVNGLLEREVAARATAAVFAPRKRDLTGVGFETRPAVVPAVLRTVAVRPAVKDPRPHARVMIDLGRLYGEAGNQPATFQLMSAAMRTSYDAWTERAGQLRDVFMSSAVFQALSGQKASEVVAVFTEFPLDRSELSRRIVAQIDRRLTAYAGATRQYIREPDLAAAVGDLLHTMVEDPEFAQLIDRDDYRRILERIGKVALERDFNAEALGALSAVGDEKQLASLGRRWSKDVIKHVGEHWIVNRDVELAIMAYTEARDFDALRDLLERCRETKRRLPSLEGQVQGAIYLDGIIERLSNLLAEDPVPISRNR